MKKLCLLTFFYASLVCASLAPASGQEAAAGSPPEEPPTIRLRGADGKDYDIASMRGQVVLVSFGATWCEPCKEELKALELLKKEYSDRPVRFLWVSIESEGEVSDGGLRSYAKQLKLSFPVLRDPDKRTFARYSGRMRLPTTLFFDKAGRLSLPNHIGIGAVNQYLSKMRERLDKLLAVQAKTNQAGGH